MSHHINDDDLRARLRNIAVPAMRSDLAQETLAKARNIAPAANDAIPSAAPLRKAMIWGAGIAAALVLAVFGAGSGGDLDERELYAATAADMGYSDLYIWMAEAELPANSAGAGIPLFNPRPLPLHYQTEDI